MRQVVFDTETTGLDPKKGHRIVEIGCVEIIGRKITGRHFQTYIDPEREIDADASKITGLTWAALKGYPVFKDIVSEFLDFIRGSTLIIHNAPFDMGFLNHEFGLLYGEREKPEKHIQGIIDTLAMARKIHPNQGNSLDALCKRYKINNQHRIKHGALLDSEILAELYLSMTAGQLKFDFTAAEEEETSICLSEQFSHSEIKAIESIYQRKLLNLPVVQASSEALTLDATRFL
ncbi:MAG: DNA polymerase III subunit epsilon [Gammaproteobacteria bacterium]